jgi:hypothetical protein
MVYKLNKEALTAILSGLDLEATGMVDELRRHLVKVLRDRAAETFVPSDGVDTNQLLSHLLGLLQGSGTTVSGGVTGKGS